MFVFAVYTIIAFWQFRHLTIYHVPGAQALDMATVSAAMLGACAGFLWWNAAPAQIIMGDTGSMAIGGAVAGYGKAFGMKVLVWAREDSLAAAQAMPFGKADVTIDAVPTAGEIDRALARLENLAKENGTAVGFASALPISIERIGAWVKALESHGIMLVPLTTAMLKPKSS